MKTDHLVSRRRRCAIRRFGALAVMAISVALFSTSPRAACQEPDSPPLPQAPSLRIGIIGLDTAHAVAFTQLVNGPSPLPEAAGCRVVAAYPHGSRDIASSVERIPQYTEEIENLGVTIVDSIEELLPQVDAVLLETNDGRPHFEQALPVFKARKPVFIDKPLAGSLTDVLAIFAAAEHFECPVFTASALRFAAGTQAVVGGSVGQVLGCDTTCPCSLEPTHPDLFWYGIHGVEALMVVMGPGCESVTRTSTADAEVAVGRWRDGRIGVYRGMRVGARQYGGTAYGAEGNAPVGDFSGYEPLVVEIVKFFRTGTPPVTADESIQIYAFMEAADESKRQGGGPAALEPIIARARNQAKERFPTPE
jgi:hypothetical protein